MDGNKVTIKETTKIKTKLKGRSYSTLFIDDGKGGRTINPNPQFFILGVEVTEEGYSEWQRLEFPEDVERAEEFANKYRK